jgi:hypothetical protein
LIRKKIVSKCLATTYETHLELAIDVFKSQNPALVIALKEFLMVLPSPKCIEDVLTAAVYQLATTEPEACRWLLRNSFYLKPEVDLVEVANNLALTKLIEQGFVPDKDFKLELDSRLQVSEQAKARLLIENSDGDRLILEEILQLHT